MNSPIRRFFQKVAIHPGECWLWTGKTAGKGYGQMRYRISDKNEHVYVHRIMWFWLTGEWAEVVMHSCDIPNCVNPAHLIGGTQKENMQDCVSKGRHISGFTDWTNHTTRRCPGRKNAPRDSSGRFMKGG